MGLLVSGSKDNLIKFWDPRTGTALTTLCVSTQILDNATLSDFFFFILFLAHDSHQHKNTIQALSWAPHGNLLASASRDQTVRVFDIRAMKEWVVLRGHKKEVCCTSLFFLTSSHLIQQPKPTPGNSTSMAPRPPDPRLWRIRRRHPPLGPLLPDRRHTSFPAHDRPPRARQSWHQQQHRNSALSGALRTRPTSPTPRDALPSARLERLGPNVPPTGPPARFSLQRPHHPFLGARAPRRRRVLLCAWWRQARRCATRRRRL